MVRRLILVVAVGTVLREAWASDGVVTARDTLVYKDGDRVQGTLVATSGGVVVFKSERFGELRVPAADAVVIKGEAAAKAAASRLAAPPAPTPAARVRSTRAPPGKHRASHVDR